MNAHAFAVANQAYVRDDSAPIITARDLDHNTVLSLLEQAAYAPEKRQADRLYAKAIPHIAALANDKQRQEFYLQVIQDPWSGEYTAQQFFERATEADFYNTYFTIRDEVDKSFQQGKLRQALRDDSIVDKIRPAHWPTDYISGRVRGLLAKAQEYSQEEPSYPLPEYNQIGERLLDVLSHEQKRHDQNTLYTAELALQTLLRNYNNPLARYDIERMCEQHQIDCI